MWLVNKLRFLTIKEKIERENKERKREEARERN